MKTALRCSFVFFFLLFYLFVSISLLSTPAWSYCWMLSFSHFFRFVCLDGYIRNRWIHSFTRRLDFSVLITCFCVCALNTFTFYSTTLARALFAISMTSVIANPWKQVFKFLGPSLCHIVIELSFTLWWSQHVRANFSSLHRQLQASVRKTKPCESRSRRWRH